MKSFKKDFLQLANKLIEKIVSKIMPFSTKALLILLMHFFCKESEFFGQNITFTQSNSVRAV